MAEPHTNGGTILVVASRQTDRESLKDLLGAQGHQLFYAVSGAQVLADAALIKPDIVLMEARLPGLDGIEVCRRMRADVALRDIPVLLLHDPQDHEIRSECFQAGATDVVSRPAEAIEFQSRIATLVRLSHCRRQASSAFRQAGGSTTAPITDLTILERIIAALSIKQEPDEILQSACEVLALAYDTPLSAAWMLDQEKIQFEIAAEAPVTAAEGEVDRHKTRPSRRGIRSPGETIPIKEFAWLQQIMEEKQLLALNRILGELHIVPDLDLEHGVMSAATLILPILVHESVAGFIELSHHTPRRYSGQELALGQSVVTAVGEAIETSRLHQRLQNYADFLDQALAQRTLELKGERYRTQSILEALGEAVVITDLEGKIQYVNQAAIELTGYSREEVLGQRMRLWRSHRQTAELYTQMLHTIDTGMTWRGEVINERRDGTLYNAALTVAPYFDPRDNEHPIGFLSIQRDITPVKEAERLKDQFVSNVSHELRTPLSIITLLTGNLDTLYENLDDEKRRKLIRDVRGHVQVLTDLISSVLEISRLDGGQAPREYQRVDLAGILREEAEKQVPLAKNKHLNLEVDGADPQVVNGNEGQLRQTIRNLLNNAIKYTPGGGYIICECQEIDDADRGRAEWPGSAELPPGRWAAFRVSDTGIGISQENLPHLFERFYRVKSQGDIPGAGLGLSIAKELVQMHSGHIAVQSTPGEGSVFAVYLPKIEE